MFYLTENEIFLKFLKGRISRFSIFHQCHLGINSEQGHFYHQSLYKKKMALLSSYKNEKWKKYDQNVVLGMD